MNVPASQPFVPVLLGGDIGTYSLAREFHEAYGAVSVLVPAGPNGVIEHSVAIELRPSGSMLDDAALVAHLRALGEELTASGARPLLLLGSLDLHVSFLARHSAELEPLFTIPYPDETTIDAGSLKQNFYALCEELDLDHPRTAVIDPRLGAGQAPAGLTYPLIGKPADSADWVNASFEGKKKVHELADPAATERLLTALVDSGYTAPFILQELIPGGDEQMRLCTFFCDRSGKVTFAGHGEVVVEEHSPKVLGNSAGIVTTVEPGLIDAGRRLLERLGWRGFAMLDAKVDPRDGSVKLFELNPRLGRNHFYLTAAGANPARMYVREWLGAEYDDTSLGEDVAPHDEHGTQLLSVEHLYTVLPHGLLKAHARGEVGRRALALLKARRVSNPLKYRAERHPKRLLYVFLSGVNHRRKFKAFPPRA